MLNIANSGVVREMNKEKEEANIIEILPIIYSAGLGQEGLQISYTCKTMFTNYLRKEYKYSINEDKFIFCSKYFRLYMNIFINELILECNGILKY